MIFLKWTAFYKIGRFLCISVKFREFHICKRFQYFKNISIEHTIIHSNAIVIAMNASCLNFIVVTSWLC